jgi:diguanylate cyclase (GGDEF)-like protein
MLGRHPVHDTQGASMGHLWVCEDVTQQRQTAAQLITLAERDALTGLYNRHCFEQALERFFRESARHAQPAAVLFFDLDEFKYVNDRFGHGAGDMVLLRVATAVKALVRETDLLSRLGGDEFAIFMPQATLHSAQLLAERLDEQWRAFARFIAHFPTHAASAQELVAHADTAMYQAKHLGKNRWSIYRAESDRAQAMVTRMAWNERIDRALAGGLLRLHFQGVYHAQERRLAHLEALVRMHGLSCTASELTSLQELVGGHPYLARLALYECYRRRSDLKTLLERAASDSRGGVFAGYLDHLRRRLQSQPGLLQAFCRLARAPAADLEPSLCRRLERAGLITQEDGRGGATESYRVRYRLYQRLAQS